jgi:phosphoribosylformylglycinamidine synthase II
MANQQAEPVLEEPKPDVSIPTPAQITPALLKLHSITAEEYARIERLMGRTPSLTELGIFSVMWSEHCSYKSSRIHLKRLPTRGTRVTGPGSVVQGPGENAGIIDVGDGWACAFKIESHNHPSYIEPHQGAATGVGGILRDIFTMNARPFAVMDSLRFGPLGPEAKSDQWSVVSGKKELNTDHLALTTDYARNRQTMAGVVAGIAGYGNCFGVPNLGGETRFEECYSGNPLVNAFALGLVRIDEIFYAKATGVGNPVIYVGAKTGRDGIHGATMASEEFTEGSEQKRPNVQMGDPFMEKLLLEACLEAMATGAVLGIQDMGAAGLTCSTCEMGARGELGLTIELDLVPQRETGMSSYEIMLSESQERMLLVADKGREGEVLAVFAKWGLDASIVGVVTADDTMRVTHHGELVAEIPNKALTDDAPVYKRPVGVWKAPVPLDPPAWVVEELKKPRDYTADLKKLLASANICDKRWVFEQYDSMVQTNTVQGPGGEAGVMRIKDSCELSVESDPLEQVRVIRELRTNNSELSRNEGWRWRWRGMGGGAGSIRSWARCMRWRRRRGRWRVRERCRWRRRIV